MNVPEQVLSALQANLEAAARNEEAAYKVLDSLETDEQRLAVVWFMENMDGIHDAFFLLRLAAAKSFARKEVGERHGIAVVVGDRVMELTGRFRERTKDDPEPAEVTEPASA